MRYLWHITPLRNKKEGNTDACQPHELILKTLLEQQKPDTYTV